MWKAIDLAPLWNQISSLLLQLADVFREEEPVVFATVRHAYVGLFLTPFAFLFVGLLLMVPKQTFQNVLPAPPPCVVFVVVVVPCIQLQ